MAQVRFQAMLTSSRYDAKSAIEYIRVTRCSRVVWSHKSAGLGSHQARRKCSGEADILYRHSGSGNTFARRCAISRITVMHIHQSLGAADSSPSHEACVQTSAKHIKPSIQHTQSRTSIQRHEQVSLLVLKHSASYKYSVLSKCSILRRTMKTWNWHKHASAAVNVKLVANSRGRSCSLHKPPGTDGVRRRRCEMRCLRCAVRRSNSPLNRVLAVSRWLRLLALYGSRARPLERCSLLASYPK